MPRTQRQRSQSVQGNTGFAQFQMVQRNWDTLINAAWNLHQMGAINETKLNTVLGYQRQHIQGEVTTAIPQQTIGAQTPANVVNIATRTRRRTRARTAAQAKTA